MTYTSLIRFAPLTTLERVNDERWKRPGRTMYDSGALTLMPGKTEVPLLINHDDDRVIGTVHTITRFEDTDGPWLACIAEIHDLPCWLTRGDTKASFSYVPLGSNDVFGCEIARRGIIKEVSVLSPSVEPAEPLAKVLTLHPTEPKASTRAAAGDTLLAPGRIVRRGIGQVLGCADGNAPSIPRSRIPQAGGFRRNRGRPRAAPRCLVAVEAQQGRRVAWMVATKRTSDIADSCASRSVGGQVRRRRARRMFTERAGCRLREVG